jgi:hypothetical protein
MSLKEANDTLQYFPPKVRKPSSFIGLSSVNGPIERSWGISIPEQAAKEMYIID